MRTVNTINTILGSVALILASSVAVEAALLVAGPLPAKISPSADTIICSAVHTTTVGGSHIDIAIDIVNGAGRGLFPTVYCPNVGNDATCVATAAASTIVGSGLNT